MREGGNKRMGKSLGVVLLLLRLVSDDGSPKTDLSQCLDVAAKI